MSIAIKAKDDRTLACDQCGAEFWGIGLTSNRMVRNAARDLEGFARVRVIVSSEPVKTRPVDLCRRCNSPEGSVDRLFGLAFAAARDEHDERCRTS